MASSLASAPTATGVAGTAVLIALTIYVFHGLSNKPIQVDAELPEGPHTFGRFQDIVVDGVLKFRHPLGFVVDQLLSGSLFIQREPPGLPTRPGAGDIPLKRGASILLSGGDCILLDLGESECHLPGPPAPPARPAPAPPLTRPPSHAPVTPTPAPCRCACCWWCCPCCWWWRRRCCLW
jgi:hypothetical protein